MPAVLSDMCFLQMLNLHDADEAWLQLLEGTINKMKTTLHATNFCLLPIPDPATFEYAEERESALRQIQDLELQVFSSHFDLIFSTVN